MIPLGVHHFGKRIVCSLIYFWSMPIVTFSPVANFGDHPLCICNLFLLRFSWQFEEFSFSKLHFSRRENTEEKSILNKRGEQIDVVISKKFRQMSAGSKIIYNIICCLNLWKNLVMIQCFYCHNLKKSVKVHILAILRRSQNFARSSPYILLS